MHFLFLSNVTVNEPPPVSPTRPLWRELPVYRTILNISLKFLIKLPWIRKFFHFLKDRRNRGSFHVPQKRGSSGFVVLKLLII
jgi:hypothetical protein